MVYILLELINNYDIQYPKYPKSAHIIYIWVNRIYHWWATLGQWVTIDTLWQDDTLEQMLCRSCVHCTHMCCTTLYILYHWLSAILYLVHSILALIWYTIETPIKFDNLNRSGYPIGGQTMLAASQISTAAVDLLSDEELERTRHAMYVVFDDVLHHGQTLTKLLPT